MVEPVFYAPAIPMVLVNGSKGIGTGFSTDVMPHNPLQIIAYIRAMLASTPTADRPAIDPYLSCRLEPGLMTINNSWRS
jgi:DNA topoisomerase-2